MKFSLSFLFFLTILTSGCGCSNVKKTDQPKLVIVNVLDKALYDDCHIKGSVHVPFEEFNDWVTKNLQDNKIDINDHIIVYCSNYMCTASGYGAKLLTKLGFKNVWAYEAGVAEWFQKGHSIEGVCQKAYLKKVLDKPEHKEVDINIISTDDLAKKIENMQK
ncbi:MAG: rhodanese-like domain-containing protein [Candidatus Babeliales bacterium]|nr:rhodanese-like domain-containing protein [Candidatus Babeliales bacterium]